ncbi:MAG: hypothetical protein MI922_15880 [Bacteroidales bacterium]|nr:hypothetical protein [Bacteroidales bacterium]
MNKHMRLSSNQAFIIIIFALLIGVHPFINAQKLDKEFVRFSYMAYPADPLPSYVKSYYVSLEGNAMQDPALEGFLMRTVKIEGLQKVYTKSAADIEIKIVLNNLSIESKKEKNETREDSKGKTSNYSYLIRYLAPTRVIITAIKSNAQLLHENLFAKPISVKSPTTSDRAYFEQNYDDKMLREVCYIHLSKNLKTLMDEHYLGEVKDFMTNVYTAKHKKPKYPKLDEALERLMLMLGNELTQELNAENKKELKEIVDIWEEELSEADTVKSKERINKEIYYGIRSNLAIGYMWLLDFDKAYENLRLAQQYSSNNESFKNNLTRLDKFMKVFESSYILSNAGYDIHSILYGDWKVTRIQSTDKYDLNKDGRESFNMLFEYDFCGRQQEYHFNKEMNMELRTGVGDNCEQEKESHKWTTEHNKDYQRNIIRLDRKEEVGSRLASTYTVKTIWHGGLELLTYLNYDGKSTTPTRIFLERIE